MVPLRAKANAAKKKNEEKAKKRWVKTGLTDRRRAHERTGGGEGHKEKKG